MLSINEVEPDEVESWQDGVGMIARKQASENGEQQEDPFAEVAEESEFISTADEPVGVSSFNDVGTIEYGALDQANNDIGVNHGNLRRDVLVEAELAIGNQFVGSV
jgi:hypothetical protein